MRPLIDFDNPNLPNLSTNELKKVADYWQRKYLLSKADRDPFNRILCPITNKYYKEDKLHVCHIIDRAKTATRYDPLNVFLGSAYSNTFEANTMIEGYKSLHHKKIEDYFGKDYINELSRKGEEIKLMSREDYINLIKHFMDDK